jgi:hypothetical protein
MLMLISTNLSGLGGRMGTESAHTNFRKFFNHMVNAMEFAQKDFKHGKINWRECGRGKYTSGDLGYVMYTIKEIETED